MIKFIPFLLLFLIPTSLSSQDPAPIFVITAHEIGSFVEFQAEPFSRYVIPESIIICTAPENQTIPIKDPINPTTVVWDENGKECKASIPIYFQSIPASPNYYVAKVRRYGYDTSPTTIKMGEWSVLNNFTRFKREDPPAPEPPPTDLEIPSVFINSIRRNGNSPNFTVTAVANDNSNQITKVDVTVNSGPPQVVLSVITPGTPFQAQVKIQQAGTHTIWVRAYDPSNNSGAASASVVRR